MMEEGLPVPDHSSCVSQVTQKGLTVYTYPTVSQATIAPAHACTWASPECVVQTCWCQWRYPKKLQSQKGPRMIFSCATWTPNLEGYWVQYVAVSASDLLGAGKWESCLGNEWGRGLPLGLMPSPIHQQPLWTELVPIANWRVAPCQHRYTLPIESPGGAGCQDNHFGWFKCWKDLSAT